MAVDKKTEFLRVYLSDGSWRGFLLNPDATAEEVCQLFAKKLHLPEYASNFQLKEMRPGAKLRWVEHEEKVCELKKRWLEEGFNERQLDNVPFRLIFTFTDEARIRFEKQISSTRIVPSISEYDISESTSMSCSQPTTSSSARKPPPPSRATKPQRQLMENDYSQDDEQRAFPKRSAVDRASRFEQQRMELASLAWSPQARPSSTLPRRMPSDYSAETERPVSRNQSKYATSRPQRPPPVPPRSSTAASLSSRPPVRPPPAAPPKKSRTETPSATAPDVQPQSDVSSSKSLPRPEKQHAASHRSVSRIALPPPPVASPPPSARTTQSRRELPKPPRPAESAARKIPPPINRNTKPVTKGKSQPEAPAEAVMDPPAKARAVTVSATQVPTSPKSKPARIAPAPPPRTRAQTDAPNSNVRTSPQQQQQRPLPTPPNVQKPSQSAKGNLAVPVRQPPRPSPTLKPQTTMTQKASMAAMGKKEESSVPTSAVATKGLSSVVSAVDEVKWHAMAAKAAEWHKKNDCAHDAARLDRPADIGQHQQSVNV